MPNFSELRIQRKPEIQLTVNKHGQTFNLSQLSQGEKSLLALVGDIARRLAMMNPGLADPLLGNGVVLIDEVDMHLHPRWQRGILEHLSRTFPNCQFILSTHSPLVISDLKDLLVYSLEDGEITELASQYGQDANSVLLEAMDTQIRHPEIEAQLNDLIDAIHKGEIDIAQSALKKLEHELPTSNIDLAKARLLLRKQELRSAKNK